VKNGLFEEEEYDDRRDYEGYEESVFYSKKDRRQMFRSRGAVFVAEPEQAFVPLDTERSRQFKVGDEWGLSCMTDDEDSDGEFYDDDYDYEIAKGGSTSFKEPVQNSSPVEGKPGQDFRLGGKPKCPERQKFWQTTGGERQSQSSNREDASSSSVQLPAHSQRELQGRKNKRRRKKKKASKASPTGASPTSAKKDC